MDGKLRAYGNCKDCGKGYQSDGSGAPVCGCGKPGGRNVHVLMPYKGQRHWIFCDRTRQSFARLESLTGRAAWEFASQALGTMRSEIQSQTFRPENYKGAPPEGFAFSAWSEAWLERRRRMSSEGSSARERKRNRRRGLKPATLHLYELYLKEHISPYFERVDIREIHTPQVNRFHDHLLGTPSKRHPGELLSEKYVANVMGCLRAILNDAHEAGDITSVPVFPELSWDEPEYKTYEDWEVRVLLGGLYPGDRPLFEMLADVPIRPGEVRALQVEDLRLDAGGAWISKTWSLKELSPRRKAGKPYWISFPDHILEMLQELLRARARALGRQLRADDFVFVRPPKRGRPRAVVGLPYSKDLSEILLASCNAWNTLARLLQLLLGLDVPTIQFKGLYPFRHSFGQDALDAGASLDQIRDLMGHSDVRMTEKYAKRSPTARRAAMQLVMGHRARVREVREATLPHLTEVDRIDTRKLPE